jgi:hypothetical protein
MKSLATLSLGKLTALITLAVIAIFFFIGDQRMFSPGPLNAQGRQGVVLGDVRSHAQIGGNCAACHAPPWSSETMADRCLDCHKDVRHQIDARSSLHGRMADAMNCRACHTEHKGAHAELTSFAHFDHNWTAYPLTGKHRQAQCNDCHQNQTFRGTSHQCASCHAEPQVHKGQLGTNCIDCHSTVGWDHVTLRHAFPLNHGNAMRQGGCAICHPTSAKGQTHQYLSYTCYDCHKHERTKTVRQHAKLGIAKIDNCAECHPFGRRTRPTAADDRQETPVDLNFVPTLEIGPAATCERRGVENGCRGCPSSPAMLSSQALLMRELLGGKIATDIPGLEPAAVRAAPRREMESRPQRELRYPAGLSFLGFTGFDRKP